MSDYLTFRRMITPLIIQIVFWLGFAGCLVMGTILIVKNVPLIDKQAKTAPADAGSSSGDGDGTLAKTRPPAPLSQVILGVFLILVGPVVVRIACEIIILIFRINETLTDLKDILELNRDRPGSPGARATS